MKASAGLALMFFLAAPAIAQQWVGARAGIISHAEGLFYLDRERLQFPAARFQEVAKGQSVSTGNGWVELQLGLNAFLWMGEEAEVQMEDPSPTNMWLRIKRGSVLVQIFNLDEKTKNNQIGLHVGDGSMKLSRPGLYRIDSREMRCLVYEGKAKVVRDGRMASIKKGRSVLFNRTLRASKFDTQERDYLYLTAARRSQILGVALWETRERQRQQIMAQTEQRQQQQQQQIDTTRQRLEIEQNRRDQEAWRQINQTRSPESQEGHTQPPEAR